MQSNENEEPKNAGNLYQDCYIFKEELERYNAFVEPLDGSKEVGEFKYENYLEIVFFLLITNMFKHLQLT